MIAVRARLALPLLVVMLGGSAHAGPILFFGEDLGAGEFSRLTVHMLADQARGSFLASLTGTVATNDFESIGATDPPDTTVKTISLSFGSDFATLTGPGLIIDAPPPGTANPLNGTPSGVYPTSGNRAWLSLQSFEVSFSSAQTAFGFYGIDIGDNRGNLLLDLYHPDSSIDTIAVPHTISGPGGGIIYVGITEVNHAFIKVGIRNTNETFDGFVFDDLTIARPASTATPEPSTLAMLLIGGCSAAARQFRRRARR